MNGGAPPSREEDRPPRRSRSPRGRGRRRGSRSRSYSRSRSLSPGFRRRSRSPRRGPRGRGRSRSRSWSGSRSRSPPSSGRFDRGRDHRGGFRDRGPPGGPYGPPRDFRGPRGGHRDDYGPPGRGPPPYGDDRYGPGGGPPGRGRRGDRRRREEGPPGVSLLVRNVAPNITTEDLQNAFGRIGEVRDVYIPRDYHSQQPKGFAFIEYASPNMAREARDEMDRFSIKGRELEVVFAQERRKTPNEMRGRAGGQSGHSGRRGPGEFERSSSFERHRQRQRDERDRDKRREDGDRRDNKKKDGDSSKSNGEEDGSASKGAKSEDVEV